MKHFMPQCLEYCLTILNRKIFKVQRLEHTMQTGILRTLVKPLPQTKVKKLHFNRDFGRLGLPAGKRVSASGKVYWETRMNRSDARGRRI